MTFSLLDIIAEVRERLDDQGGDLAPVNGFSYPWEAGDTFVRWKNAELVRYVNRTRNDIYIRAPATDSTTAAICQIPVLANVNAYAVDPRVLSVEYVRLGSTGKPLRKRTTRDLDHLDPAWRTRLAPAVSYREDYEPFSITIAPLPAVNDILYLTVKRLPLADADWTARTQPMTEPSEVMREALIEGVLRLAWRKRDSETYQPEFGKEAEERFDQLAGPPVDAWTLQARRENANLSLKIRPRA
jgi:hypothetical protein